MGNVFCIVPKIIKIGTIKAVFLRYNEKKRNKWNI